MRKNKQWKINEGGKKTQKLKKKGKVMHIENRVNKESKVVEKNHQELEIRKVRGAQ